VTDRWPRLGRRVELGQAATGQTAPTGRPGGHGWTGGQRSDGRPRVEQAATGSDSAYGSDRWPTTTGSDRWPLTGRTGGYGAGRAATGRTGGYRAGRAATGRTGWWWCQAAWDCVGRAATGWFMLEIGDVSSSSAAGRSRIAPTRLRYAAWRRICCRRSVRRLLSRPERFSTCEWRERVMHPHLMQRPCQAARACGLRSALGVYGARRGLGLCPAG
jgi:hypothetical protein